MATVGRAIVDGERREPLGPGHRAQIQAGRAIRDGIAVATGRVTQATHPQLSSRSCRGQLPAPPIAGPAPLPVPPAHTPPPRNRATLGGAAVEWLRGCRESAPGSVLDRLRETAAAYAQESGAQAGLPPPRRSGEGRGIKQLVELAAAPIGFLPGERQQVAYNRWLTPTSLSLHWQTSLC